jgi:uncharacterized phage protein (TIGR01671 family)
MRDIKFRFWSNHLQKFVVPDDDIFVGALKDPDMNPMQYTGLKDKNGTLIFEGDILATPYVTPMGQLTDDEEEDSRQSVVFKHGGFVLDYGHYFVRLDTFARRSKGEYVSNFGETFNLEDNTYFEVIGNIYENPELAE